MPAVPDQSIDTDGETVYHVLWVRHCQSESNVTSLSDFSRYSRQPYCTSLGVYQSAADGLSTALQGRYADVVFFSSPLVRAMETAALLSGAFARAGWVPAEGETVQRLPSVSETASIGDMFARRLRPDRATANTLRIEESTQAAEALNDALPSDCLRIRTDDGGELARDNGSEDFVYDTGFHARFADALSAHDRGLSPVNGDKGATLNIVAAHGNYISEVIKRAQRVSVVVPRSHPRNLSGYLAEYAFDSGTPDVSIVEYFAPPGPGPISAASARVPERRFAAATTSVRFAAEPEYAPDSSESDA